MKVEKDIGNTAKVLEVVVVLDRSGSMDAIRSSTIAAFNGVIDKQLKDKDAKKTQLSLFLFNENVDLLWNGVPLSKVEKLSYRTYEPSGNTALFDAIGRAITETDLRLSREPPEGNNAESSCEDHEVIIVILSDGLENSSRRFGFSAISSMIRQKITQYNWDFLYLGPDQSSKDFAIELGFPEENIEIFPVTNAGIHDSCNKISEAITRKKRFHSVSGWKGEDTEVLNAAAPSTRRTERKHGQP